MEWGLLLLVAVLASGLGFAGGRLAVVQDRHRRGAGDADGGAAFRLDHQEDHTWSLVNVGRGTASLVHLLPFTEGIESWPPRPVPGQVETVASDVLPTLAPGASMSVWFSRYDRGQRVIVSWTSTDEVRRGPVVIEVPAPR